MTPEDIIAKRKASWETESKLHPKHDIQYDAKLVQAAIISIHSDRALAQEVIDKPWKLIEIAFTIVDKKGKTVPFFFNEVQADFIKRLEKRKPRKAFYVLKGRQQGFTSLITAVQLAHAIVKRNFSGFTVANTQTNTDSIFNDKARSVYERLPGSLKPHEKFNNRKEYFFDKLNSSWRVATASADIGRSKTLAFCHFSEIAFYECSMSELQQSIGEALTADAIVVYETTANGFNEAKDLWDSGSCENLFYEWWRTAEYAIQDHGEIELKDAWITERVAWLRAKGVSEAQIAWYVEKYDKYLDKNSIKQEYPCTPDEAFLMSGSCVFGNESVIKRLDEVKDAKPVKRGYFTYNTTIDAETDTASLSSIEWVDDEHGEITIHALPVADEKRGKRPYAIGGDTAGDGSDYFTAKVIDSMSGQTVATYRRQKIDDDLYADQLYCLGQMYNDAIIGVEVNFGYTATARLDRLGYPNIYFRERIDALTNRYERKLGFKTTSLTKPTIVKELIALWRDSEGTIECDAATLREMLTFVKDEKGSYNAVVGKHDDLVMALAIAHHVAQQGDQTWKDIPAPRYAYQDELDDIGVTAAEEYITWE